MLIIPTEWYLLRKKEGKLSIKHSYKILKFYTQKKGFIPFSFIV